MNLRSRHLLGIETLSPEEITLILDTAESFAQISEREIKKVPTLRGRTVVNFFVEPSTRTRSSFEIAEKRLSADSLNFSSSTSSLVKGETLADTARNLEAMAPDFIVIRHSEPGAPHLLAKICRASIINAGDGAHEHPTQALLDAYTIRRHKRRLEGLRVAIIGDIAHSRVVRSNIHLLLKMGAQVVLSGPATLMPRQIEKLGVDVTCVMDQALEGADVVMMLRVQMERQKRGFFPSVREYFQQFGLTKERLARARPDAIVMHPGPINRGVELASDVADGASSVILEQVTNGVAVRMAVLYLLAEGAGVMLLLRGGRVVDPATGTDAPLDVLIQDGQIARIAAGIPAAGARVIELRNLIVAPGFVDMHVHLREPGQEWKETIESGARAAAAGGFTAVACMPNTVPVNDKRAVTEFIRSRAQETACVRVYPIGAITKGQEGEELAEIGDLVAGGVIAISDDGKPVVSGTLFRKALEYASMFGIPVIDHCEDPDLSDGGVVNEGRVSTLLGLKGWNRTAEDVMVSRDLLLAEETGGRVHIAHASTRGSLQLVRAARARGVKTSVEVAPHHFALTEDACLGYDTSTKMNPPLRTEDDRRAILEALGDGTVDAIATDHAPHHADEKEVEFARAPFGVVGLETAVSIALDRLVSGGVIGIGRMIELFSTGPCRILGVPGGRLAVGLAADLTILDPERVVTIESARFCSKSRNTPFEGWQLKGAPVATIVAGELVYDRITS